MNLAKHIHMLGAWNLKLVTFSNNGNLRPNDKIKEKKKEKQKKARGCPRKNWAFLLSKANASLICASDSLTHSCMGAYFSH